MLLEVLIIGTAALSMWVGTGRFVYALLRRESIRKHGLDGYTKKRREHDADMGVWLGAIWPVTWAYAVALGVVWLLDTAVSARPYRSKEERRQLAEKERQAAEERLKVLQLRNRKLECDLGIYAPEDLPGGLRGRGV